eukprot:5641338-Pleurochrysis_carterae.AAC.1
MERASAATSAQLVPCRKRVFRFDIRAVCGPPRASRIPAFALQICCSKAPASHSHTGRVGYRRQGSQSRWPHGCAKGVVEVNAAHLSAALFTQPRFERAATFSVVHPYQAH